MSQKEFIDFTNVNVEKLKHDTIGLDTFESTKEHFTKYLKEDALQDMENRIGQTWVFLYENQIIGFITLALADMNRKESEKYHLFPYGNIPALLVGRLGTHKDYVKCNVGMEMLYFALEEAKNLSKDYGCRLLMLNPEKDVVKWYTDRNFTHITHSGSQDICFIDIKLSDITKPK